MSAVALKWISSTATVRIRKPSSFSSRALIGTSSLDVHLSSFRLDPLCGNMERPHWEQSPASPNDTSYKSDFHSSTSTQNGRKKGDNRLCQHEVRRSFSTTPTPFSRKKNVKTSAEAEIDKKEFEPSLSFNYRATIAILEIARAVSPVISMNAGFTLTSNFDLRIDGTSPIRRPKFKDGHQCQTICEPYFSQSKSTTSLTFFV